MIRAVCGGKGGTGKSTFSIYLALKTKSLLVDTDIGNPNLYLLIDSKLGEKIKDVYTKRPKLIKEKCKKCGICAKKCKFNAIFWVPGQYPKFLWDLCEGCGVCWNVCPFGAIVPENVKIGEIYYSEDKMPLLTGFSDDWEGKEVITELIKIAKEKSKNIVFDCPAGIHCNMIRQVIEADEIFIVTEPTPLGINGLKEALETVKQFDKKVKVVINKSGIGNEEEIYKIAKDYGVEIYMKIPYSDNLAEFYSKGKLLEWWK